MSGPVKSDFAWKIPARWEELSLCNRVALYPALYLRWAGRGVLIAREVAWGAWINAERRLLVTDGPLAEDERELMALTAARGADLVLAPQASLDEADRALAASLGVPILAWTDDGPLASAPLRRPGTKVIPAQGCAARLAEDLLLAQELGFRRSNSRAPRRAQGHVILAVDGQASFEEVWPAVRREALRGGLELMVACDDGAALVQIGAGAGVPVIDAADPDLLSRIADAQVFLCAFRRTPPDSPRPGQWVRSALFQGVPVVAASHAALDGLAHLCVMDDWERGLALYRRFPGERLKAAAAGQRFLADRLQPAPLAAAWTALTAPRPEAPRRAAPEAARLPLLLTLIDIHQDLDILLPVLLALRERGEVRLRLALTDWLVTESPRVLNLLTRNGFSYDIYPRDQVRRGDAPLLGGVDGVLSGADTNVRAHKSGHTLVVRANERGLKTFTVQHGFENIGLTYKDQLHDEGVRFAARTIFIWGAPEGLAPWAAPETRAAALPVGAPKAAPAPAARLELNQGHWPRTVGVFENLHWHRFSDAYRERFVADLETVAAATDDALFLVKPHHAGRWMARNKPLIRDLPNLVVIDPLDSAWEPHTAPALIASVDLVLTTPSTVALDAARAGRPLAVFGYDLDLPLYEPLPIIRSRLDLAAFLDEAGDESLLANEAFLARAQLPGRADHRIAGRIAAALWERMDAAADHRAAV